MNLEEFKKNYKKNKKGEYKKQHTSDNKKMSNNEKLEFYEILKHFNVKAPKNIVTKYSAYKILVDNFKIIKSKSKRESESIFEE